MILSAKQLALREYYQEVFKEWETLDNNLQNVFTPYDLCEKMIDKVCKYCELKGKKILVTNLEFAIVLIERGIDPKDICFLTDCEQKAKFGQKIGVEIMSDDFFDFFEKVQEKKEVRTFGACITNPPYQTKSDKSNTKTQAIWDKFVACSVDIVEQGGTIAAIHPSGWRNVNGMFSETKNILQSKKMHHLSIHNADDGMKTFGCATRYDWYVMENSKADPSYKTEIDCENEEKVKFQICELPFIPNFDFDVFDLVAKIGEKGVDLLWSCDYHTQARSKDGTIQKDQTDKFCYPCIQHVAVNGEPSCIWYSSLNSKGHFGIPKVIFSSRQVGGAIIDEDGKYGMCQDCSAIAASKKDLKYIKEAMDSTKFIDLMKACDFGGNRDRYPRKIIETFRKDFWKEFVQ